MCRIARSMIAKAEAVHGWMRRSGGLCALAIATVLAFTNTAFAADPVTLPDIGVDPGDMISAISTGLGAVLQPTALAGGAIFVVVTGFLFIRKFMRKA